MNWKMNVTVIKLLNPLHAYVLILSWRRPISYRNQYIDLQSKSVDWFLYGIGLRHERVNSIPTTGFDKWTSWYLCVRVLLLLKICSSMYFHIKMSKEIANLFVTNRSQIDLKFLPEYGFKKRKSILNRSNLTRVCEIIIFSTCAHIKKVKKLPIFLSLIAAT